MSSPINNLFGTPPELRELATIEWCLQKRAEDITENVILAYFVEMKDKYSPSTLWKTYSILKCQLKIKKHIDIEKFTQLKPFLKACSKGHQKKKV